MSVREYGYGRRGFFNLVKAAAILGNGDAGTSNLPVAGFATQLGHELVDLCDTGCTDRVPFGDEAAGWIDGHLAAEARGARFAARFRACTARGPGSGDPGRCHGVRRALPRQ